MRIYYKTKIATLQRKNKNLSRQLALYERRKAKMDVVMEKLKSKNLLGEDQLGRLAKLGKANHDFLKRQMKKLSHDSLPRKYSS